MYDYPVRFSVDYPERSSRLLALARFFLGLFYIGIPHGIFAIAYGFLSLFVVICCYVAVLIRGTFPLSLFDFLIRYNRYLNRVVAYCFCMTDKYPPFSGRR
jgi:hypothetical protein